MIEIILACVVVVLIAFAFYYRGRIWPSHRAVLHYTNWCPHCINFQPIWNALRAELKTLGIKFSKIDEDFAHTSGINTFPTILLHSSRGTRQYSGPLTLQSVRRWMLDKAKK